jgi:hypothetical protein
MESAWFELARRDPLQVIELAPQSLLGPALMVYQDSKIITTNEGWPTNAAIAPAAIQTGAFALPSGSKDAAVLITLNPGAYSAQVKSAKNASSGVALIEIYEVP